MPIPITLPTTQQSLLTKICTKTTKPGKRPRSERQRPSPHPSIETSTPSQIGDSPPAKTNTVVELRASPRTRFRNAGSLLGDSDSDVGSSDSAQSFQLRSKSYTWVLRNQTAADINEYRQRKKNKGNGKRERKRNKREPVSPRTQEILQSPRAKKRRVLTNNKSSNNSNSNTNSDDTTTITNTTIPDDTINADELPGGFTYVSNWEKFHPSVRAGLHKPSCMSPMWMHCSTKPFKIPSRDTYFTKLFNDNHIEFDNNNNNNNNSNKNKERQHLSTVNLNGLYDRNGQFHDNFHTWSF